MNQLIRNLIKSVVVAVIIISIPVKIFNYLVYDFHWRTEKQKLTASKQKQKKQNRLKVN